MIYINEIFSINYQDPLLQKVLPFLDFFVHEMGLARVKHILSKIIRREKCQNSNHLVLQDR